MPQRPMPHMGAFSGTREPAAGLSVLPSGVWVIVQRIWIPKYGQEAPLQIGKDPVGAGMAHL